MRSVAVVAAAAESALGSGRAAYAVGEPGEAPRTRIAPDARLRDAGFAKPLVGRAPSLRDAPDGVDPARALLELAARELSRQLDAALPDWRRLRMGIAVGTSSGGMITLCHALALRRRSERIPRDIALAAPYFGPLRALAALGVEPIVEAQVLAACASSGVAIGLGCRWLELDAAELVVAGGYDAVGELVASGFESLGATSARGPLPFRKARDGMSLGEGAALVALVSAGRGGRALGYVRGFGMSSDAVHVTAPDATGAGLARAATAALADAGVGADSVDLVSAHATATTLNDAAEARALQVLLGERARDVVVHPMKAIVGHTLGASSALEALSALDAMDRGILPAAAGEGELDPAFAGTLLERNTRGTPRTCLKLSAAFGGANAALVLSRDAAEVPARPLHHATLLAVGEPRTASDLDAVASRTKLPKAVVSRLDPLSAAVVAAVESALSRVPSLDRDRMAVVVGSAAATLEIDAAFDQRLRDRGPRGVDPRRFPSTSPNLAAGNASIAFGLLGPSLSVGASPDADVEALGVGRDLVRAGDAESVVVVAAEQVGEVVRELWAAMGLSPPADGAAAAVLGRASEDDGRIRAALRRARETRNRAGWDAVLERGWPAFLAALGAPP